MSFGTGLIVSSGIQFYNQILEPSGEFFGRIYALLHGKTSFLKYGTGGTNLWGILMILGMTILVFGIWEDPLQKIKEKLLKEIKENQEIQAGEIDKILHDHTYEQLNDIEKEQYDQILRYYQLVNITMIGLLTGYPVVLPELRGTSDIATSARIDEFLSFLNIAVGSRRRKSRSNKDINQSN